MDCYEETPDHTGAEGPTFCGVSKQPGRSERLIIVLRGDEATMAATSREQSRGSPPLPPTAQRGLKMADGDASGGASAQVC